MKKYADQDDEDRELAMIALGHIKLKDTASKQDTVKEEKAHQKTNVLANTDKAWDESMSVLDTAVASDISRYAVSLLLKISK
jgi:hypothetical protein